MTMGQQNERIFMTRAEWKTFVPCSWPLLTTCRKILERGQRRRDWIGFKPRSSGPSPHCLFCTVLLRVVCYTGNKCLSYEFAISDLFYESFWLLFISSHLYLRKKWKKLLNCWLYDMTIDMSSLCVLGCDPRHRCGCLMHYCSCPVRRGQQHQREKEQIRESLWHS